MRHLNKTLASLSLIESTIPDLPGACHPKIYSNNDVRLPFVGGCPDRCLRHTVDASERILDFVVDLDIEGSYLPEQFDSNNEKERCGLDEDIIGTRLRAWDINYEG